MPETCIKQFFFNFLEFYVIFYFLIELSVMVKECIFFSVNQDEEKTEEVLLTNKMKDEVERPDSLPLNSPAEYVSK